MGIEFDKFFGRLKPAKEIVRDEDLAIAAVAGTDADRGDFKFLCELAGERAGNTFEHDGEDAGILKGEGFFADGFSGLRGAGLNFVAAELEDGLRFKADVSEDGDVSADDFVHGGDDIHAAFDFNAIGAGFFDEAAGVTDSIFRGNFVGKEGHVSDNREGAGAADDHAGVIDHFIEGDGQGGAVAGDDVGEGIADEEEIEGALSEPGSREPVVGSEGDDFIGAVFAAGERGERAGRRRRMFWLSSHLQIIIVAKVGGIEKGAEGITRFTNYDLNDFGSARGVGSRVCT